MPPFTIVFSLLWVTWMLIIRSVWNLWVPLIVMVLRHFILLFIKEPTHKLGNCLELLLTDVAGVDTLVDPPLGNSGHSSISFSVKMGFKILKSWVDWPRVGEDLCNLNWSAVFNNLNPVSELNKEITSLIDRCVPSKIIRQKVNFKAYFNEDFVNLFHNKQNACCFWSQNRSFFLWDEDVVHRCHVQSVYNAVLLEYNNRIRESLSTAMHPHKWWSTLKTFLFGVNSSLPPIRTDESKKSRVFSTVFSE